MSPTIKAEFPASYMAALYLWYGQAEAGDITHQCRATTQMEELQDPQTGSILTSKYGGSSLTFSFNPLNTNKPV